TAVPGAASHTLSVTFPRPDPADYTPVMASVQLMVTPAPLTVTADASRWYGRYDASATVTATYTGLVNGDTGTSIGGPPQFQDNPTYLMPPRQYPLTPYGLTTTNYPH